MEQLVTHRAWERFKGKQNWWFLEEPSLPQNARALERLWTDLIYGCQIFEGAQISSIALS